jgi:membrane fusion protein (multidrug efflux system)
MRLAKTPAALIVTGALFVAACGGGDDKGGAGAGPGKTGGSKPVGVVVEAVREESFPYEIEALGTANANEAVTITAKVSNLVTAIRFEEGQQVRRGQVLVELDGAETRAELDAAKAALSESRSQFRRAQELRATQALSQAELERLEATVLSNQARVSGAQSKFDDTVVRAPFDGRVGLRRVSVGSFISPGAVITTLDDTRTIKLDFSVPENFMAVLEGGMAVTARSVAYPDREFTGKIASIDSRVDPVTRSVIARALIPNPGGELKPGMFLTLRLRQPRENVTMVSEESLVPEEGKQFVFVVDAAGKAARRQVSIGRRKPGSVEVLQGLTAGERVVVEGTQLVKDGAQVNILTAAAAGASPGESTERRLAPE